MWFLVQVFFVSPLNWNMSSVCFTVSFIAVDSNPYRSFDLTIASKTTNFFLTLGFAFLQYRSSFVSMLIHVFILCLISLPGSPLSFNQHPRYLASCVVVTVVFSINRTRSSSVNRASRDILITSHLSLFNVNHYCCYY